MGDQKPGRVLIIEDELQIAELISKRLTKEGFLVDFALDGSKGFDLAHERSYDAIILDLVLPGMDGIDLLERLRSQGIKLL